jgi:hypothetical protein
MPLLSLRVPPLTLLAMLGGCSMAPRPASEAKPSRTPGRVEFSGAGSSQLAGLASHAGELFAIGSFEGALAVETRRQESRGEQDLFVARLTQDGAVRWLRHGGGPGDDVGDAIAVGPDGSLLVAGGLSAGARFEGTPLPNEGGYDGFVAKLSGDDGHPLWVRSFGGAGDALCRSVAVDGAGNVFVTGFFTGEVNLGLGLARSAGANDTFLVKLSGEEGTTQWAHALGGKGGDIGRSVAVDAQGTVLLTGHFSADTEPTEGAVDFGTGPVLSAGDSDAFLAAFSGDGRPLWARALGGPAYDMAKAVVPAPDGSLYLTGLFQRGVARTPGQSRFAAGGFEGFVGRTSSRGEERWRHRYPTMISGHAIALTAGGGLALVGHFASALTLREGNTLQAAGPSDAVAAIFDAEGHVHQAWRLGGPGADYGYAVAAVPGGVVAGGIQEVAGAHHGFLAYLPWP